METSEASSNPVAAQASNCPQLKVVVLFDLWITMVITIELTELMHTHNSHRK